MSKELIQKRHSENRGSQVTDPSELTVGRNYLLESTAIPKQPNGCRGLISAEYLGFNGEYHRFRADEDEREYYNIQQVMSRSKERLGELFVYKFKQVEPNTAEAVVQLPPVVTDEQKGAGFGGLLVIKHKMVKELEDQQHAARIAVEEAQAKVAEIGKQLSTARNDLYCTLSDLHTLIEYEED